MKIKNCNNLNHSKMNVSVRFCPSCGDVVNRKLPIRSCSEGVHLMRIKERNNFCVDCGKPLFLKK